jgi:hypothetical protein
VERGRDCEEFGPRVSTIEHESQQRLLWNLWRDFGIRMPELIGLQCQSVVEQAQATVDDAFFLAGIEGGAAVFGFV